MKHCLQVTLFYSKLMRRQCVKAVLLKGFVAGTMVHG